MCTGRSTVVFIILFSLMGAAQAAKLKGISYTAWWPGAYSTADADRSLAALAETGA